MGGKHSFSAFVVYAITFFDIFNMMETISTCAQILLSLKLAEFGQFG